MEALLSESELKDALTQIANKYERSYRGILLYLKDFAQERTENIPDEMTGYTREDIDLVEKAVNTSEVHGNRTYSFIKTIMNMQDVIKVNTIELRESTEKLANLADLESRYNNATESMENFRDTLHKERDENDVELKKLHRMIKERETLNNFYSNKLVKEEERTSLYAKIGMLLCVVTFIIGYLIA